MSDAASDNLKTFADCTTAIEHDSGNAEAYYQRGAIVLKEALNFRIARGFDSELAERFDNSLPNYYTQAATDLDTSIQLRPDFAPAYLLRGECDWLNRTDLAIAFWEEAISIDPDYSEGLLRLTFTYATDPDAKFRNGQRAVELGLRGIAVAENPDVHDIETLAAAYAEAGDFQEAMKVQQQAIELHYAKHKARKEHFARASATLAEQDPAMGEWMANLGARTDHSDSDEYWLYRQWQRYRAGKCYSTEDEPEDAE